MKVKYLATKAVLIGIAILATPAVAIVLTWRTGTSGVPPEDSVAPQAASTALDEPLIIRIVVIQAPSIQGFQE